ncbi:hypothetical protein [Fodinicola acaciae]|uniref:hypothetical protein n=1 Tax=Fodinicola acaciae TaxID=2681555 RepID=UPI0013CF566C|nr:hypothetical protein [Fodinicola acaciae]
MTVERHDLGHRTVADAEHWLADRPPVPGEIACTHLVRGDAPHVAVTIADEPVDGGRAVRFPGVEALTGTLTVADLLEKSAIDQVRVIGGAPATPETLVDTRDFVRPLWMDGVLTLVCTPAAGGRIAPFEVPNPTPCCADHR